MAGLNDTDIKLDSSWQLTPAATGDAPTTSGFDCLMQDIRLEAVSVEGELFYDEDWGWSLIDFAQSENDDLAVLEIKERVRSKLERRAVIDPETIGVSVSSEDDALSVTATFRFAGDNDMQSVSVSIDRINIEVVTSD